FDLTVNKIQNKYGTGGTPLSANGLRRLVQLCLSGKEITKRENIDGIPLGSLEKDGIVFLKPVTADLFQVIVPLVFATAFNRSMNLFDGIFVTYRPMVTFQALEKFGRDFEVFENNLFIDLGIKETTFGERFSGALMSDKLAREKIVLNRMTAFHAKREQLP